MTRRTSATLIGLFVLTGISLLVGALILFGGDKYFTKQLYVVCYFDGSINGLQVGSPVKFRGAKVGEVSDIRVEIHHKSREISLPVILKLQKDRVYEEGIARQDVYKLIKDLISRGLRAQLSLQSIVTGQLYVELDFHPETPIKLKIRNHYLEMPTIPSSAAEIANLAKSAREAFDEIQKFLNSKNLTEAIKQLSAAMKSGEHLMVKIDTHIDPVTARAETFLDNFSETLRSIRVLTEYLSRHPEALLMGKYKGRE